MPFGDEKVTQFSGFLHTLVSYLREILPLETIKFSSRKDLNLKEMLASSVPYAHREGQESNQLGSCSRCGNQRCGFCKLSILAKTNKFCSFTVRFKYLILGLKLYFCKRYLQNRLHFM